MTRRALVVLGALALSCGPSAAPRAALPSEPELGAPDDPAPPPRSDGRLPPGVTPLGYRLELTVDPNAPSFMGRALIGVRVEAKTRAIVLHARGLDVMTASVSSAAGKQWAKAKTRLAAGSKGEAEELVLAVERELAPGAAEVDIQYQAKFADGLAGLYRVEEGGRKYAFTQFEPTDARRAFPCFDEPSFKVPFELAVTTPKDLVAVSNMPLAERREHHQSELTTHTFVKSPPLPTYLIALAVGELDVAEGEREPIPTRVVTAKGKAELGASALADAKAQLVLLADYFGEPYPYPKLDLVAVPDFAAGAMENPGLVTFREELLLLDAARASASSRRALAGVMAHELAHQWFGNLVTLAWWDDLWLNEGFASWMGTKILDRQHPALGAGIDALASKSRVMALDALSSARKVRQPVRSSSEALEAFDGITYVKGMSILGMVESWVGEERFREGVRQYVREHRHGTATAKDLFAALDAKSGEPVSRVMDGFLDQTGVPLLEPELDCSKQPPVLRLAQRQWRPLGVVAGEEKRWTFPVCVEYTAAKQQERGCTLLEGDRGELALPGARCPLALYPNAGDRGYYHFTLSEQDLGRLVKARLGDAERLGLVGNAWALVKSGALGADAYLRFLGAFERETQRVVWERISSTLDEIDRALVGDGERPAFAALVNRLLVPSAKKLGWEARQGESDEQRLLRKTVLSTLARHGDDAWMREQASALAARWLADPASVDADVARVALSLHAKRGDASLFGALQERVKSAATPEDRLTAIGGLTAFDDPTLVSRALELTLDPAVLKAQDVRYVLPPLFARRESRDVAWRWLQEKFDLLQKRLPPFVLGRVAWVVGSFCDDAAVERARAFLGPRLAKFEGADKPMRQAVEAGKLCAALAREQKPRAAKALGGQP